MENASKALLIAGGVFLALLTISMFVLMINNVKNVDIMQKEQAQIEDIKKWNQEWEVYNKENMYGAEVLTVLNKSENSKEQGYNINFDVYKKDNSKGDKDYLQKNKSKIFKCIKVDYVNGYVSNMEFKFYDNEESTI